MYDFAGWATKNDIRCSDGRIIRQDAFKECDGKTVPLVWNHDHNNPDQVLGHAALENRSTGVYAYCSFNDTQAGKNAKELVKHGDVVSLSIYANHLKQHGSEVLHGAIREVSLVLAGANPGALIESVISHGEMSEEEAVIYTGEGLSLSHADDGRNDTNKEADVAGNNNDKQDGKTVQDVFDSLTEEQKQVVYFLIGSAVENAENDGAEDDDDDTAEHSDYIGGNMKYNLFSDDGEPMDTLSHAEAEAIFADAKRGGSLKAAVIEHGIEQIDWLFPEAKNLDNPPAWITRPMGWVSTVMGGVHHSPFSRVKSMAANLTEDEARAKGYIKGKQKKEQVFSLLRRTTTPKTIYKTQKLDRDDIIDITDFDVVSWVKGEMRTML
ncbi:MAG: HK97 family phage prohead protease, partial [Clostridia bacterium]|nr:HK97 family phage prohead protease [Clostridia bacterium]